MYNTTEERIKRQIEESSGKWTPLSEKESSYFCYELGFYEPVFYTSDKDGTFYYYYSYEGNPLRVVRKGKDKVAEILK